MKYTKSNPPLQCMMTESTCYKGTRKMSIKGVLWHSTGCNNPQVKRYVQPSKSDKNYNVLINKIGYNTYQNDWNHTKVDAGLNAWIGRMMDGSVASVQTMPWNYRPWGCGSGSKGSCNDGWIQFEICEDNLKNESYFNAVYKEACELTAYLCTLYKIDPLGKTQLNGVTVPTILCHYDSYKLGLGSGHVDITHWFPKYGKSMDTVRKDVAALMGKMTEKEKVVTSPASLPILKLGDSGRAVRNVMLILKDLGYYTDTIPAYDNTFGPKMNYAVHMFQRHYGLEQDGIVGEKTYEMLFKG